MTFEADQNEEFENYEIWYRTEESLALYFNAFYTGKIQPYQISEALFILLGDELSLEWTPEIWDYNLSYEKAIDILKDFNFDVLLKTFETGKHVLPGNLVRIEKARIKVDGLIWIIHRYDADPFPSNPHAHQVDNNIKLDLSNGNCYRKRQLVHTIRRKELLEIRQEASNVFKGELPPLLV